MRNTLLVLVGLAGLALSSPAFSAEYEGVNLPDTTQVADQTLVLNGYGMREKFFMDIYVGALYLPATTSSADTAINDNVPKKITMSFLYRKLSKEKMLGIFTEALEKNPETAAMTSEINQLKAMFDQDVFKGDVIAIEYDPAAGTSISFNGKKKGTVAGEAIMRGLWGIFVGPNPPTEELKEGMLTRH